MRYLDEELANLRASGWISLAEYNMFVVSITGKAGGAAVDRPGRGAGPELEVRRHALGFDMGTTPNRARTIPAPSYQNHLLGVPDPMTAEDWLRRFSEASPEKQRQMLADEQERQGFELVRHVRGFTAAMKWLKKRRRTRPASITNTSLPDEKATNVQPIDVDRLDEEN